MAVQEQLELLRCGVYQWNQWRRQQPYLRPDLSGVDLQGVILSRANLNDTILFGGLLTNADLTNANLTNADLSRADLTNANLSRADLLNANLAYANLHNAMLRDAVLNDANLMGADLTNADLTNAALRAVNLRDADLNHANLCGAYLLDANLRDIILNNADLSNANLTSANLHAANLTSANLHAANLTNANLSYAYMDDVDLSGAHFNDTIFAQVNLSLVKGLDAAVHDGSSLTDINTVIFPQDVHIRTYFLRGVGFTETQIEYLLSLLVPQPIQYQSLFISYARQDEVVARQLHANLCKNKVSCWFAPHDLQPGNYFRERIDQAIHSQDKLLLLLSEHSINSGWVRYEVELALARENREQREILFPLRLDDAIFGCIASWAVSLQAMRHIGDFTNWQDEAEYQDAFSRLLRDLKVSKSPMI